GGASCGSGAALVGSVPAQSAAAALARASTPAARRRPAVGRRSPGIELGIVTPSCRILAPQRAPGASVAAIIAPPLARKAPPAVLSGRRRVAAATATARVRR